MTQCMPPGTTRSPEVRAQATLSVNDKLSDFPNYYKVLKNQDGASVTLSSFVGKAPVVLFFYPAAATPGCTKEVCGFRDKFEKFTKGGAKVCTTSTGVPVGFQGLGGRSLGSGRFRTTAIRNIFNP